jgi:LacI family transcriptional regulator
MNLEEIAKIAGVSRSTVSRVINNHPNVSRHTRDRVRDVIQEQHYHPNLAARSLVVQETHILSLVIPQAVTSTFTDPYFPMLIQSVMERAYELDYAVMLWVSNKMEDTHRYKHRILRNSYFDGLLIAAAVNDDPIIPYLSQANFPFVIIGPPPVQHLNYIDIDNENASEVAVLHLLNLGWERVATITGPMNLGSSVSRMRGYLNAFQRAGKPVDETLIVEGNYDEPSGYQAMRTLIERGANAVFCASDMMALGALRAIAECGLKSPDNIGIVSFDDLPVAAAATPPLTTIRQPIQALGSMAAQMLVDLLNGQARPPYQRILPASLIVRESCGANRQH